MKFHDRIVEKQDIHLVAVLSFKLNDRWLELRTGKALEVGKLDDGNASRGATDQMAARHHRRPGLLLATPQIGSRGTSVGDVREEDAAKPQSDDCNQHRQAIEEPRTCPVAA